MSRTYKFQKPPGDLWSRRSGCLISGKTGKLKTKQQERTENKKLIREAYINPDKVRGRFAGE